MRIRSLCAALTALVTTATVLVAASPAQAVSIDFCTKNVIIVGGGGAVSTERDYSGSNQNMLRARSGDPNGPWEQYWICWPDNDDNEVYIYSRSASQFVAAEYDYTGSRAGMLRARTTEPGPWETFQIIAVDDYARVVILGSHGLVSEERDYTGSNKGMLRVRGNGTGIGPWEKFRILDTKTLQPVHYFFPLMS